MINLLCFIENFPLRWKLAGWLLLPEQVRVKLNSNRAAQWFASLAKAGKKASGIRKPKFSIRIHSLWTSCMSTAKVSFSFENVFSASVDVFRTKHVLGFCWERNSRRKRKPNQNNILRPFFYISISPNLGCCGTKMWVKRAEEVQQQLQQLASNA